MCKKTKFEKKLFFSLFFVSFKLGFFSEKKTNLQILEFGFFFQKKSKFIGEKKTKFEFVFFSEKKTKFANLVFFQKKKSKGHGQLRFSNWGPGSFQPSQ